MKKALIAFSAVVLLTSCGGGDKKGKEETKPAETKTETPTDNASANPNYQKGLDLVAQSDCLTCHKVDEAFTGPTYRDIAKKYDNTEANVKMLAEKIIKGGKGNWGEAVMTPHSGVSQADAEAMVKYIFTLKN